MSQLKGGKFSKIRIPSKNPDYYLVQALIYHGAKCRIYKCFDIKSRKVVTIKSVYKKANSFEMEQEGFTCLVYEYAESEKWDDIYKVLTGTEIEFIIYKLLDALIFCHQRNIMHRDIHPENLMICRRRESVVLIDWKSATFYRPQKFYNCRVGSLHYRSPEMLLDYPKYDLATDIWSVGCIMAGALFRVRQLFYGENSQRQLESIVHFLGSDDFVEYLNKYSIPQPSIPFIFRKRTDFRSYVRVDLRGKADNQGLDLLNQILVYDPQKRLTAYDAFCHPYFDDYSEYMSTIY
ncbi:unnamed protein product [Hymenolepis diminuta]|uniref:non-specific serine/threonine protein kinase n=1 Tax=Hymenolepis diminuta TaxID=6216 RepID=A0A0R3SBB9_HYMDI|nr:unnamed protein product [Hymenolepis diminuta]